MPFGSASIKKVAKRVLRPVWVRIRAPIVRPIEARLSTLESSWRQNVPLFLNAVSSVAALGFEVASLRQAEASLWQAAEGTTKNIGDLWHRVEFIRREILFEFKYARTGQGGPEPLQPRIIAPDKVANAVAHGPRLNLGCGHNPLEDYINIDMRELPDVDIIADVGDLPFEKQSVREIFSAHVLEHFPQERLRRLLPYWRSLLNPEGVFRAIVPDGETMLAELAKGNYSFEQFREVLFGTQEYEGDFHFNLFTPESLVRLISEAGFKGIEVPVKGRRNGDCFEFEVRASVS